MSTQVPLTIPSTMKAAVYRGEGRLCLEEVEVPKIESGEILVRVASCGVCPTDIKKIHFNTVAPPRIFGHETSGTIVRTGLMVRGFEVGERVGLHHHVPCTDCHFCRHHAFAQCATYRKTGITAGFEPSGGGFAEYVRVMPFCLPGVVRIPQKNSFLEGALLEPVNTVLKGIQQLGLLHGDTVLVCGQGPIGLLFTKILTIHGMRVIATDLLPNRLLLAKQWGAWKTIEANESHVVEAVARWTEGRGADAAVVAVPSDGAVLQAQAVIRGAGRVLLFAHTVRDQLTSIDLAKICVDEKALVGSYSSDFTLQKSVARLVFSRKLDVRPLITHTFPLAQTAEAVGLAAKPTPESLKVVVLPGMVAR